jgi:DNA-binding LacI/PurR family transcriptional regulator
MKSGPRPHHSEIERAAAVENLAREHGMPVKRISVFGSSDEPDAPAPPMPAELEDELRAAGPGELVVVAYNTLHARRLAHSAATMGLAPGIHYGLTCCDDNHDVGQTWPGLSRMSVDRVSMGEMAANMLLQTLRTPKFAAPSRTVVGRWIDGNTSGPPPVRS